MPELDIMTLLTIAALLTSALAAIIGQGGGMLLMAVIAPFIPASALIPLHGTVQLASNASRAYFNRADISLDLLLPIAIGMLIGCAVALPVLHLINSAVLLILAGSFILYSTWRTLRLFASTNSFSLNSLGFAQGALGVLIGATGPLGNALLKNLGLDIHRIIATNAVIMSLSHVLKVAVFTIIGVNLWLYWPLILSMTISSILGSKLGTRLRKKIPTDHLTSAFKWALTLLSLNMIRLGLQAL